MATYYKAKECEQLVLKPTPNGNLALFTQSGKLIAGQLSVTVDNAECGMLSVTATFIVDAQTGVILEGHKNG